MYTCTCTCTYASQSRTDCNFVNCIYYATLGEYTVQVHVHVCMYLHVHVHGRQHMPITMEVHKDDSEPKKVLNPQRTCAVTATVLTCICTLSVCIVAAASLSLTLRKRYAQLFK